MIEIEIDFSQTLSLERVSRDGFGAAEPGGAWMLGPQSRLVLPPPPRDDGEFVLQTTITPYLIPGAVLQQRFRVLVNGHPVFADCLDGPCAVNAPIPPAATMACTQIEIIIEHPDARSPSEIGAGEDVRPLAGRIARMTLFGHSALPADRGVIFHQPIFHTRARDDLASRMWQHLVAVSVQTQAPHVALAGIDLPEWGIASLTDTGTWSDDTVLGEHAIDPAAVAALFNAGGVSRIVHRGIGLRLENLPALDVARSLFQADPPGISGFDARHLVIDIAQADTADALAVGYYQQLLEETGLLAVFVGDSAELRTAFPDATFMTGLDPIPAFELLRRSANLALAPSLLSWLAGYLSQAEQIHLPVTGLLDPSATPGVDLLPTDDPRFWFRLPSIDRAIWRPARRAELAPQRAPRAVAQMPDLPPPVTRLAWQQQEQAPLMPPHPAGALPLDVQPVIAAAEAVAADGHLLDVLHYLRQMPLIDFASLLWSLPRSDLPGLSAMLPAMAPVELQTAYTGRSGADLCHHTVDALRITMQWFERLSGRPGVHIRMLDFGCGWGRLLRLLPYFTDPSLCWGVDANPTILDQCYADRVPGRIVPCDYLPQDLEIGTNRIDLITAYSVFTHTPNPVARQVLAVLRRKISPRGMLMLTIRPAEFWQAADPLTADAMIAAHRTKGFAYRSAGLLSQTGEELYGDISMTLETLAALAPDWAIEGYDRGMDKLQTLVFLTPR